MRFETMALHAGDRPDTATGVISVPIYQTSTFVFEDVGKTKGWDCSRMANSTRRPKVFSLAESLGGITSLAERPATMSHASMSESARRAGGITDDLIRLSIGLENVEDLIEDLGQALDGALVTRWVADEEGSPMRSNN